MALKTDTRTIGPDLYSVTQLPAMRGFKLFRRITAAVGPGLSALASAARGVADIKDMDVGKAGEAVALLMSSLSDDDLELITRELLWAAKKNGAPLLNPSAAGGLGPFETEMAGEVLVLGQLLYFAFEVNYGNFSAAVRQFAARQVKEPSPSSGSSTSETASPPAS